MRQAPRQGKGRRRAAEADQDWSRRVPALSGAAYASQQLRGVDPELPQDAAVLLVVDLVRKLSSSVVGLLSAQPLGHHIQD